MASIDGGMQDAALIKGRHGLLSLTGPSGDAHREPLDSVSGSPHSAQKTPLRRGFFVWAAAGQWPFSRRVDGIPGFVHLQVMLPCFATRNL